MSVRKPLFVAALAAFCLGSAFAEDLYAATAAGGEGQLYRIDAASGAVVQQIGVLNDAAGANYGITGLAFDPTSGVLFGSAANADPNTRARLVTINPLTAEVTFVGMFNTGVTNSSGVPATMADIAFNSAGQLFGVASIGGPQLYSINKTTGQATVIGNTGLTSTTGGGLAISSDDVYYGTPTASRYGTYDPVTGAYTNIANPVKPVGGAYAALAFNSAGTLFGLNLGTGTGPPTHIVTIDRTTGTVTDIGASVDRLDAIAFGTAVPEPASMIALGAGIAGVLAARRRRRQASGS